MKFLILTEMQHLAKYVKHKTKNLSKVLEIFYFKYKNKFTILDLCSAHVQVVNIFKRGKKSPPDDIISNAHMEFLRTPSFFKRAIP